MIVNDHARIFESTLKMPFLKLPANSTLLRTSRGLLLISPGRATESLASEMTEFGRITDIVAPSLLHHLWVHKAQAAFPQATVWCAKDLNKKRPDVRWDKAVTKDSWTYRDEIEVTEIKGTKFNEVVFFHIESQTLVVTDLFFNLVKPKDTAGFGAWIILKIFGTFRRFGMSSFYLRGVTDQAAFRQSLLEVSKYDFKTIIVAHGDPVTQNAREMFDRALRERKLI